MVSDSRFLFSGKKIRGRGREETHHRFVVEQWRIGDIDQDIRAGKGGGEADAYAREVIAAEFDGTGDEGVVRKVMGDLKASSDGLGEEGLRAKMVELMAVAAAQVKAGT